MPQENRKRTRSDSGWLVLALGYLVVAVTAGDFTLLFSLFETHSWIQSGLIGCATAVLVAGALFTIVEIGGTRRTGSASQS